jgi:hypothetical protein
MFLLFGYFSAQTTLPACSIKRLSFIAMEFSRIFPRTFSAARIFGSYVFVRMLPLSIPRGHSA